MTEPDSGNGDANVIRFHFIKAEQFRNIHVDGAHGGVTPKGLIQVAIYNERVPIPREVVHTVSEDGHLGDDVRRVPTQLEALALLDHVVGLLLGHGADAMPSRARAEHSAKRSGAEPRAVRRAGEATAAGASRAGPTA